MTPVCFYIDGFNLYHALVKFSDHKVKWLDLYALSKRLILPATEQITGVFYFSAYADWLPGPWLDMNNMSKLSKSRELTVFWVTSRESTVTARAAEHSGLHTKKRKRT